MTGPAAAPFRGGALRGNGRGRFRPERALGPLRPILWTRWTCRGSAPAIPLDPRPRTERVVGPRRSVPWASGGDGQRSVLPPPPPPPPRRRYTEVRGKERDIADTDDIETLCM